MAVAGTPEWSLRLERAESSRLAWCLSLSIAFHALLVGLVLLVATANRLHWWDKIQWPAWLKPAQKVVELLKKKEPPPVVKESEPPLMFIEVNPAAATPEPPKNAQYYSSVNAVAANPEPDKDLKVPKITGLHPEIPRTEDAPRKQAAPLQPTPPAPPTPEPQPELREKPKPAPGDLAMGKPDPAPKKKEEGQDEQTRPRTIKEALARLPPESRLAGQKMKQEGGTRRRALVPSFDTKATLYGEYDYAFIHAVEQHWFALLDEWNFASESRGKVELHFKLHADGRITDMEVTETTAGEVLALICQKAVLDPAPFAPWSREMKLNLEEPRKIQFTFYYY